MSNELSTTSFLRKLYGREEFQDAVKREWITCENCHRDVLEYVHVPVFDYIGCFDCYHEAMAELQRREAATLARKPIELALASVRDEVRMLFNAGATLDEYRAYKTHFDKEVA